MNRAKVKQKEPRTCCCDRRPPSHCPPGATSTFWALHSKFRIPPKPLLLCLASFSWDLCPSGGPLMVWQGEALPLLQDTDYWRTASRNIRCKPELSWWDPVDSGCPPLGRCYLPSSWSRPSATRRETLIPAWKTATWKTEGGTIILLPHYRRVRTY